MALSFSRVIEMRYLGPGARTTVPNRLVLSIPIRRSSSYERISDKSLAVLLEDHEELHALFDSHQRARLAKDIDNAVAILLKFQESLLQHIGFEEAFLLPKYAQEGGETAGGTLAIFQAEHQKLKTVTERLTRQATHLYGAGDLDAQIIAIFDEETLFKGLFEHHALREKNILIPRLDALTTSAERMDLLAKHA
jgi:hemerythrin-like domain-containing protein